MLNPLGQLGVYGTDPHLWGGGTCGAPAPQNLPDALRQEVHACGRGEVCQLKAKCARISARGLDPGPTEWLGVSLLLGWMGGTRRLSLSPQLFMARLFFFV